MVKIPLAQLPPFITNDECDMYKYKIAKEKKQMYLDAGRRIKQVPDLHAKNTYFNYFRDQNAAESSDEHKFTYDQVKDSTTSHQKVPRDTCHPKHSPTARVHCIASFTSGWKIRTSQAYGWLPPIDTPRYGYGRISYFESNAQDKSHLMVGVVP
jgi:hypothetical protein